MRPATFLRLTAIACLQFFGAIQAARFSAFHPQTHVPRQPLAIRGGGAEDKERAIFDAIKAEDLETVTYLVSQQGAEINKLSRLMDSALEPSALHYACFNSSVEMVEGLVRLGADVNLKNSRGYTALHYAALLGKLEHCKILVELGANLNASDSLGDQPIDRAQQAGRQAVVDWMKGEMEAQGIARRWAGYETSLEEVPHPPAFSLLCERKRQGKYSGGGRVPG